MTALSSFVVSLCAAAILFSLLMLLVPEEGAGRAVRVAASAFLLVVILSSAGSLFDGLEEMDLPTKEGTVPPTDQVVEQQAEAALTQVAAHHLDAAGCAYSGLSARVTYGQEGFTGVELLVEVADAGEKETALLALSDLAIPVTIRVKGEDNG